MSKGRDQFGNKKERLTLRCTLFKSQNEQCKNCGDTLWLPELETETVFLKRNKDAHPDDMNTRRAALHEAKDGPELWCQLCKSAVPNYSDERHIGIRINEEGVMEAVASNGSWMRVPKAAAEEILRCHERLEIDRVWRLKGENLEREDVSFDDRLRLPDGIECRDTTIRLIGAD